MGETYVDGGGNIPVRSWKEATTFDEWFLEVSKWGLSYDQLVTCSISTPGNDPGDTLYTSPSGSVMTRHMCSHWINFYGAASMGWNAHAKNTAGILERLARRADAHSSYARGDTIVHIRLRECREAREVIAPVSRS